MKNFNGVFLKMHNSIKKVVVTGGSGFIGTNCVQMLLNQKYDVINLDINEPLQKDHTKFYYHIDIKDKKKLENKLLEFDPDYIIHLAGETGMESLEPNFYDGNYISAQNICDISHKLTSLKKVVFTSSLLVCRNGYIPISDHDFCPPNGYGHSKALSEIIIRESNIKVPWDIVRPTSIWGPWFSGGYSLFFKLVSKGLFFNPRINPIIKPTCYVGNAVHMIHQILLSEGSNRVFYLADYPQISVQDWANLIYKNTNHKKDLRTFPVFILRLFAKVGDFLSLIGLSPPLTSSRLNNMLVSKEYPTSNTQEIVGKLPFDREKSVIETIKWMNG